jgi:ribosome-binding factor A
VSPDDLFFEIERSTQSNWKLPQLCKQVERAASEVLSAEMEGAIWTGAWVAGVEPAPDASRLQVVVVLAREATVEDLPRAHAELLQRASRFRFAVAGAIHRKRTPELAFHVLLTGREPS